ncbi:MAG: histone deacetylase [Candidatus Bathyarchaeota archaeon]|nr:MAG: histone deacetylase [Candidatus Bathyarchaeota archaeon]
MTETAIIFTPKYYEHDPGSGHPETSKRLRVIMKEVRPALNGDDRCKLVEPGLAPLRDLELVHASDYIQLVKRICKLGGGLLDIGDTVASPESYTAARYAVGGAIKASDLVLKKKATNAFALVRPPGHHAGRNYAAGFCIFNNVAIAASHLIKRQNIERILILDIDAHHGNGTQEIFYGTKKVLYISLHEDPREFPGTGFIDEVGESEGRGYNVNIPFPFRTSDKAYLRAIDGIVIPIISQYAPQFILISAGYDGYHADPVAKLSISAVSYATIFDKLLRLASRFCRDRLVVLLEGGYNLRHLGKLAMLTISRMSGFPYSIKSESPPVNEQVEKHAEKVIENVKKVQSVFWNLEH